MTWEDNDLRAALPDALPQAMQGRKRHDPKQFAGFVSVERAKKCIQARLVSTDSCWEWGGTIDPHGYGALSLVGYERGKYRRVRAHRLAFFAWKHDTPLPLDHLCRNRRCVNPDHLEPVTWRENVIRGVSVAADNAKKTHCLRGHSLHDARVTRSGFRDCRECKRLYDKKYREADPEMFRLRANEAHRRHRAKKAALRQERKAA